MSWRVSYELIRRSGGDWKVRLVFIGELMSDEEPECRSDEMSSRCVDRSCKDHAHQQPLEHERHRQTPKTKTHPHTFIQLPDHGRRVVTVPPPRRAPPGGPPGFSGWVRWKARTRTASKTCRLGTQLRSSGP